MGLALADHEMTKRPCLCGHRSLLGVLEAVAAHHEANLQLMFDQQSRNVLGHITDVDNAMWTVDLTAHGLNR